MAEFWFNQALKFFVLYLIAFSCGLLVTRKGVKVNYTRKIYHFTLFLLPIYLDRLLGYDASTTTLIWRAALVVGSPLLFVSFIRGRVPAVATMYSCIDRPEDRPYTLVWWFTQTLVAYIVIIIFIVVFKQYDIPAGLIYVPLLINGIGDGLAEPVGVRFGKHKYQTRALFGKRKYTRSYEGSACVFIVSVLTILVFQNQYTQTQFLVSLAVIPIVMTLAEAFSPHTWDSPFLFLVGGLTMFGIARLG